jgi:hypothetical protein
METWRIRRTNSSNCSEFSEKPFTAKYFMKIEFELMNFKLGRVSFLNGQKKKGKLGFKFEK